MSHDNRFRLSLFRPTLDKLVQPAILAALTKGPIHGYRLAERIYEMMGSWRLLVGETLPPLTFVSKIPAANSASRSTCNAFPCP